MDISFLEEFVDLVETCSFQETAENMNMSQSSLTKHIHKMEEELGVVFFDRSTRSVKLNTYSQAFYPYAKQILNLYYEACQALQDIENQHKNVLRIAFTPSLGQYDIIEMLSQFSRQHPQYELEMNETPHVVEMTSSHRCDFGFLPEDDSINNDMNQLIYQSDHLVVALSDKNPLSEEKALTVEQIADEPLVLHTNPEGTPYLETRKLLKRFEEKRIKPHVAANISRTQTILKMVREDRGIAILNERSIPKGLTNVVILDLEPIIAYNIYVVYPTKGKKTTAVSAFLRFIIDYITPEMEVENGSVV